ncbi:TonB family protein [Mesorhizobium sp. B1-1-9]|uniref:energy transducer TonB family protein n=1 Tax=Mesorhizobium sp. B1-1-9 TaxID=2589975 RepID=UPI001FEF09F3|nr:TonB family protein [Mesorhizobium sp. B1-1-9]
MGLHPAFTRNTAAWPLAGHDQLPPSANELDLTILLGSLQVSSRDMQDISPLPDASAELAIKPIEPLALVGPTAGTGKWATAIVISGLLHAAVAFLISSSGSFDSRDSVQPEGSDQVGDKIAGSALDKDPAAVSVKLVPSPPPAKPEPARAARPVPPTKPSQPEQETVTHAPEPVRDAAKQASEPSPEPAKQSVATPDILVAATPRLDNQSVAAENMTAKTEAPVQPGVQAETVEMPVAVPDQPPIPSARPTPAAAPSTTADEKRGTADGRDELAPPASKGKKQKEAGRDAEFSYRSDVVRKLSRVNRSVPPSVQLTARNNAVVTFVIGSRGGIDELRILQSSGSPNFDQTALGIVHKAAPFPPIPPQAASSSLEFEAEIGPF